MLISMTAMGKERGREGGRERGREGERAHLNNRNGKARGGETIEGCLDVFNGTSGLGLVAHGVEAWRERGREGEKGLAEGSKVRQNRIEGRRSKASRG